MGVSIESGPGELACIFEDEEIAERISEGSADKAGGGGVSSASAAGPTADQILAMVPPTATNIVA
jgi:hypothetical protein